MTDAILSVAEYGNPTGRPIVALHGGRCTKHYWERTATEGIPDRRWICVDLRCHGDSVKEPPWTVDQLARDVVATLDSLDVERFDAIGASLGGAVSFALARIVPSRLRSLILVDPAASTPEEYLGRPPFHAIQEADTIDEFLEPRVARLPLATRKWAEREVMARLEQTPAGRFSLRSRPAAIAALQADTSSNLPPNVGRFAGRTLLLASGLANVVTEVGKEALRAQLGASLRVMTYADAGHNLLWDAYDETVDEIATFLAAIDQDSTEASVAAQPNGHA